VTAQHGANDSPILFRHETETRVASQIRSNDATRAGLVQSHTPGAPPQRDDRVVIFDSEMAHDRSTGARGTRTIMLETEGSIFFGKLPPIVFTANNKVGNWKAPRQMPMTIKLGTGNSGA